jgi:hypothetical protein
MTVNIKEDMEFANLLETTAWTPATLDASEPPNTGIIFVQDVHSHTWDDELVQHHSQELSEVRTLFIQPIVPI